MQKIRTLTGEQILKASQGGLFGDEPTHNPSSGNQGDLQLLPSKTDPTVDRWQRVGEAGGAGSPEAPKPAAATVTDSKAAWIADVRARRQKEMHRLSVIANQLPGQQAHAALGGETKTYTAEEINAAKTSLAVMQKQAAAEHAKEAATEARQAANAARNQPSFFPTASSSATVPHPGERQGATLTSASSWNSNSGMVLPTIRSVLPAGVTMAQTDAQLVPGEAHKAITLSFPGPDGKTAATVTIQPGKGKDVVLSGKAVGDAVKLDVLRALNRADLGHAVVEGAGSDPKALLANMAGRKKSFARLASDLATLGKPAGGPDGGKKRNAGPQESFAFSLSARERVPIGVARSRSDRLRKGSEGSVAVALRRLSKRSRDLLVKADSEVPWPPTGPGWENIPHKRGGRNGMRRPDGKGGWIYCYQPEAKAKKKVIGSPDQLDIWGMFSAVPQAAQKAAEAISETASELLAAVAAGAHPVSAAATLVPEAVIKTPLGPISAPRLPTDRGQQPLFGLRALDPVTPELIGAVMEGLQAVPLDVAHPLPKPAQADLLELVAEPTKETPQPPEVPQEIVVDAVEDLLSPVTREAKAPIRSALVPVAALLAEIHAGIFKALPSFAAVVARALARLEEHGAKTPDVAPGEPMSPDQALGKLSEAVVLLQAMKAGDGAADEVLAGLWKDLMGAKRSLGRARVKDKQPIRSAPDAPAEIAAVVEEAAPAPEALVIVVTAAAPPTIPGVDYSRPFPEILAETKIYGGRPGWGPVARQKQNEAALQALAAGAADAGTAEALRAYSGRGGIGGSLNEFYTPSNLIAAIWKAIAGGLPEGARVLEPSCGPGAFLGTAPEGVHVTGVEIDEISAGIAAALHPQHKIVRSSMENFAVANLERFDAVVGNPPFGLRGGEKNKDPGKQQWSAERYFLDTALDKTNDGGIVAMVLPTNVLDGDGDSATAFRAQLDAKAELLSAHRLPSGTFAHAGTDVATDVVFLLKRPQSSVNVLLRMDDGERQAAGVWDATLINGQTFHAKDGRATIHGEQSTVDIGYGRIVVKGKLGDAGLAEIAETSTQWEPRHTPAARDLLQHLTDDDERALAAGALDAVPYHVPEGTKQEINGHTHVLRLTDDGMTWRRTDDETELATLGKPQADALVEAKGIGEAVRELLAKIAAGADAPELDQLRMAAQARVLAWVGRNGQPRSVRKLTDLISDRKAAEAFRATVGADGEVSALLRNPIVAAEPIRSADPTSVGDVARRLSIELTRGFRPADVAEIMHREPREVELELLTGDDYSLQADGTWLAAPDYLSGDLYQRRDAVLADLQLVGDAKRAQGAVKAWAEAEKAKAGDAERSAMILDVIGRCDNLDALESKLRRQQSALEAHMDSVPLDDVPTPLRAAWIPIHILNDFMAKDLGSYEVRYDGVLYTIVHKGTGQPVDEDDLRFQQTLRSRNMGITKKIVTLYRGLNRISFGKSATAAGMWANMERDYREHLLGKKWRSAVEDEYNRRFQAYKQRTYSTQPVELPGWDYGHEEVGPDGKKRWVGGHMPHGFQHQVIRAAMDQGKLIVADDVGLGKTTELIGILCARRAAGLAKRTAIVVPGAVLWNWRKELEENYPGLRVQVIGEEIRTDKNGKPLKGKYGETLSRSDGPDRARKWQEVAQGQWDVTIASIESYTDVGLQEEHRKRYFEEDWTNKKKKAKQRTAKAAEKERTAFLTRAAGDEVVRKEKGYPTVDELGLDTMIVDEVHNYKNLFTAAGLGYTNVKYLGAGGKSQRATDFHAKLRRWHETHADGKGLFLASATPVKNSPLEAYTSLTYLAPGALANMGVPSPQHFLDMFAVVDEGLACGRDGAPKTIQAVTGFQNLKSLRRVFSRYMVMRDATQVGLAIPKVREEAHVVQLEAWQKELYDKLRDGLKAETDRIRDEAKGIKESVDVARKKVDALVEAAAKAVAEAEAKGKEIDGDFSDAADADLEDDDADEEAIKEKKKQLRAERKAAKQAMSEEALKAALAAERKALADARKDLADLMEDAAEAEVNEKPTHVFSILDAMGKVSSDPYLARGLFAKYGIEIPPGKTTPKMQAAADSILAQWRKDPTNATQIAFSDNNRLHYQLRDLLIAGGMPADSIALLNAEEQKTKAAQQAVSDEFNRPGGKIMVVIGNTKIAGEGVNLQKRTSDIHHLDVPWDPGTLQQRNGRAVRQGNKRGEVGVHYYLTQGTMDAAKHGVMAGKDGWRWHLFHGTSDTVDRPNTGAALTPDDLFLYSAEDYEEAKKQLEVKQAARVAQHTEARIEETRKTFKSLAQRYRALEDLKQRPVRDALKERVAQDAIDGLKTSLLHNDYFPHKDALDHLGDAVFNPKLHDVHYPGQAVNYGSGQRYVVTRTWPARDEIEITALGDTGLTGIPRRLTIGSNKDSYAGGSLEIVNTGAVDLLAMVRDATVERVRKDVAEARNISSAGWQAHGSEIKAALQVELDAFAKTAADGGSIYRGHQRHAWFWVSDKAGGPRRPLSLSLQQAARQVHTGDPRVLSFLAGPDDLHEARAWGDKLIADVAAGRRQPTMAEILSVTTEIPQLLSDELSKELKIPVDFINGLELVTKTEEEFVRARMAFHGTSKDQAHKVYQHNLRSSLASGDLSWPEYKAKASQEAVRDTLLSQIGNTYGQPPSWFTAARQDPAVGQIEAAIKYNEVVGKHMEAWNALPDEHQPPIRVRMARVDGGFDELPLKEISSFSNVGEKLIHVYVTMDGHLSSEYKSEPSYGEVYVAGADLIYNAADIDRAAVTAKAAQEAARKKKMEDEANATAARIARAAENATVARAAYDALVGAGKSDWQIRSLLAQQGHTPQAIETAMSNAMNERRGFDSFGRPVAKPTVASTPPAPRTEPEPIRSAAAGESKRYSSSSKSKQAESSVGDVFLDKKTSKYMVVNSVDKPQYFAEDGLSFGMDDDSGWLHRFSAREASAAEAAPLRTADEAAAAKILSGKARAKAKSDLVDRFRASADKNDWQIPSEAKVGESVDLGVGGYGEHVEARINKDAGKIWILRRTHSYDDDRESAHALPWSQDLEASVRALTEPKAPTAAEVAAEKLEATRKHNAEFAETARAQREYEAKQAEKKAGLSGMAAEFKEPIGSVPDFASMQPTGEKSTGNTTSTTGPAGWENHPHPMKVGDFGVGKKSGRPYRVIAVKTLGQTALSGGVATFKHSYDVEYLAPQGSAAGSGASVNPVLLANAKGKYAIKPKKDAVQLTPRPNKRTGKEFVEVFLPSINSRTGDDGVGISRKLEELGWTWNPKGRTWWQPRTGPGSSVAGGVAQAEPIVQAWQDLLAAW